MVNTVAEMSQMRILQKLPLALDIVQLRSCN